MEVFMRGVVSDVAGHAWRYACTRRFETRQFHGGASECAGKAIRIRIGLHTEISAGWSGERGHPAVPAPKRRLCALVSEAAPCGRVNRMKMAGADTVVIRFQYPKCGHELEQTIANLKLSDHMICKGCGVGINIDTNRLANAADEIQSAIDKVPPEITIKFFH
jgi:hypothetical protein